MLTKLAEERLFLCCKNMTLRNGFRSDSVFPESISEAEMCFLNLGSELYVIVCELIGVFLLVCGGGGGGGGNWTTAS